MNGDERRALSGGDADDGRVANGHDVFGADDPDDVITKQNGETRSDNTNVDDGYVGVDSQGSETQTSSGDVEPRRSVRSCDNTIAIYSLGTGHGGERRGNVNERAVNFVFNPVIDYRMLVVRHDDGTKPDGYRDGRRKRKMTVAITFKNRIVENVDDQDFLINVKEEKNVIF